jgi:hypothetical protein
MTDNERGLIWMQDGGRDYDCYMAPCVPWSRGRAYRGCA